MQTRGRAEQSRAERMGVERQGPKIVTPRERALVVAYLSYALDDVRALSEVALRHLQMAIRTVAEDTASEAIGPPRSGVDLQ